MTLCRTFARIIATGPRALSLVLVAGLIITSAHAQGRLERIEVPGASLEGNLEGDSATREVFVYLPESYSSDEARRFPVVYFLHGYGLTAEGMWGFLGMPGPADSTMGESVQEMILVFPDAMSVHSGSMYSSSPTTGDWETYVARDLVGFIDDKYRTIRSRESRGLAGHSMGGYGTLRIAMKQPGVFGSFYAMSACCVMNAAPGRQAVEQQIALAESGEQAPGGPFANVLKAQAAAWSPNPDNPPLYVDWPWKDGEAQPVVQARWAANSPLVFVDQYVPALESYDAIMVDVGDADTLADQNVQFAEALSRLGIDHEFELYEGDHTNRVAARFRDEVLPFFSGHLQGQ